MKRTLSTIVFIDYLFFQPARIFLCIGLAVKFNIGTGVDSIGKLFKNHESKETSYKRKIPCEILSEYCNLIN